MAQSFKYIAIYPPIGVARVGDSENDEGEGWFIAPEVPLRYRIPKYDIELKDKAGKVQRQAVRFRVYAFDNEDRVIHEITHDDGYEVEWTVHVANKKASWYKFCGKFQSFTGKRRNSKVQLEERGKLNIDPGLKSIKGIKQPGVPLVGHFKCNKGEDDVYLGELQTDDKGRLIFLAGRGKAGFFGDGEIHADFDNEDWYDDTCDGEVSVVVQKGNDTWTSKSKETNAWVLGVGPKFSHDIIPTVSLYDVIEDINHQNSGDSSTGEVNFDCHIGPLLTRPVLTSWVNNSANSGHGHDAGKGGYFLDSKKWQTLSNPDEEHEEERKNVFDHLRTPGVYLKPQAKDSYMPALSGDDGRATPGSPRTWLSLTQLQYDRMKKWADGGFTNTPLPGPYGDIDDVPLDQRLELLTEANLEMTTGGAFYPGIEISYNAEYKDTYRQSTEKKPVKKPYAFRFNNMIKTVPDNLFGNLTPGDITKPLSLPWQSDFYECSSFWWPATRPDDVVTQEEFNNRGNNLSDLPRAAWTRGFRKNDVRNLKFDGSTDMVNYWSELGVIVEMQPESGVRTFVEKSRSFIPNAAQLLGHQAILQGQLLEPPIREIRRITSLDMLIDNLQFAMEIELTTIPLYLYTMYSINTKAGNQNDKERSNNARNIIRDIVQQEMLHLCLAGNILLAVGGHPKLYDKAVIPRYPQKLQHRKVDLGLDLAPATIENIDTFIELERPLDPPPRMLEAPENIVPYDTIGQFYGYIEDGIEEFGDFKDPKTEYQFTEGVISNKETAKKALTLIVDQGEGAKGETEESHWAQFRKLRDEMNTGGPLQCYPVPEHPHTEDYKDEVKMVSLAFDAAYCSLLKTIETLWQTKDHERENLYNKAFNPLMREVMAPLARFLVQQPIGNGKHAAPCFDYYMSQNLKEDMNRLILGAIGLYKNAGNKKAETDLRNILPAVNDLP